MMSNRYDAAPFEPGKLIPFVLAQSDPKIYSLARTNKITIWFNVLDLYANFSPGIWGYFITALAICTILSMYCTIAMGSRTPSIKRLILSVLQAWWDFFMLLMDLAPTSVSEYLSVGFIWSTVVLAMYYGIHIVLMNTLSADLMAAYPLPTIDTLPDLLHEPEFRNVKPIVSDILNMLNMLETAQNDSIEHELYIRIMSNNDSIFSVENINQHTLANPFSPTTKRIRRLTGEFFDH